MNCTLSAHYTPRYTIKPIPKKADGELIEKALAEKDLAFFIRRFWPYIDPAAYVGGWHITAICEHLEAVSAGDIRHLIITVPPRHMKLIRDDEPVITPTGWRTHGELKVGDYVFSLDGKPRKIIAVSQKAYADMEIEFTNKEVIKCNSDHLWTVYDRNKHKYKTLTTEEIYNSDFWPNRARYNLPFIKTLIFPKKKLELHPYFIGCWLGDGTNSKPSITHSDTEIEVINKIEKIGYKVERAFKHPNGKAITTYFSHQGIIQKIRKLNLYRNKHIPDEYKYSSIEQRLELMAGLIDTDGNMDKKGRARISTSSKRLAQDIYDVALTLAWHPYILEMKSPGYENYGIKGKPHYQVGFNPRQEIPVALPRKRNKRLPVERRIGIKDVRKAKIPEIGNCIKIDHPDGIYLVGKTCIPTHNSIAVSVAWPAWSWIAHPEKQYLTASYAQSLSIRDAVKSRRIIESPLYQRWYGDRYKLTSDQNTKIKYENDHKGHRIATSVGGSVTGEGGDIIIIDDAHNVVDTGSDLKRLSVLDWWDTAMSTRLNDAKTGAYVLIAQRVHYNDLIGHVLEQESGWVHLNLPAEYEPSRSCVTVLGWRDPRQQEGELLWPERFGKQQIDELKEKLGTYGASAQLQQRPTPAGGGTIQKEWFRYLREKPPILQTIQVWDTAFKAKESNDYSVCQTWLLTEFGYVLWELWRDRVNYPDLKRMAVSLYNRDNPDLVIIEDAASGQSLIQDFRNTTMPIRAITPDKDKVSRATAVTPAIEAGKVYLREGAPWLVDFLDECIQFPRGEHDDQVDVMVHALTYLRGCNIGMDNIKGADSLAAQGDW